MAVVTRAHPSQTQRCNEECLRRIAARLCRLDAEHHNAQMLELSEGGRSAKKHEDAAIDSDCRGKASCSPSDDTDSKIISPATSEACTRSRVQATCTTSCCSTRADRELDCTHDQQASKTGASDDDCVTEGCCSKDSNPVCEAASPTLPVGAEKQSSKSLGCCSKRSDSNIRSLKAFQNPLTVFGCCAEPVEAQSASCSVANDKESITSNVADDACATKSCCSKGTDKFLTQARCASDACEGTPRRHKSCGKNCRDEGIKSIALKPSAEATKSCQASCCDAKPKLENVVLIDLEPSNCKESSCSTSGEPTSKSHCATAKETALVDEDKAVADSCCSPAQSNAQARCCEPYDDQRLSATCCASSQKGLCDNSVKEEANSSDCGESCCAAADSDSEQDYAENCCTDDCCKLVQADKVTSSVGCVDHMQAAFERFEALIRRSQCICRSVVQQLGFCCCSLDSDGTIANTSACKSHAKKVVTREKRLHECVISGVSVSNPEIVHASLEEKKSTGQQAAAVDPVSDAERGLESVTLKISGMTCTGCSRKMENVLKDIPAIQNPQVTFVSEIAEFSINSKGVDLKDLLRRIEKKTGFKCFQVVGDHQHLDILSSASVAEQLEHSSTPGLISVEKGKKGKYRLTYDPHVIGARHLIPPDATLAPPVLDQSALHGKRRLMTMSWYTGVAAVFTIPVVVLNWSANPVPDQTRAIVSLILTTVVQAIAFPEFYVPALKSLIFSHVVEMDMLVVISITAAYVYSVVAFGFTESGIELEQEAFFATSALLITLVLFGRLMAAIARVRAFAAVSIRSLQSETTLVVQPNGEAQSTDARLLQFGDAIRILPHARIVTDGVVLSGTSAADESMVTGETVPVAKQANDSVIAGTINGDGVLIVRLTRLPGANSITDIANLVENALNAKARIQDLADEVASWFVPAVVGVAIVVLAIWIGIAVKVRNEDARGAIGTSITYAVAVLAVSCPCALGLAVPMVLVIAGGVAARAGVIIKAAGATERGYKVTDVVFDKTGTLTKGDLVVVEEQSISSSTTLPEEATALVAKILEDNSHPVSRAVAFHLKKRVQKLVTLEQVHSVPGSGIEATWNGQALKAGNPYWLAIDSHTEVARLLGKGMTLFCVTLNDLPIVIYGLKSSLRDEASSVVESLEQRGLTCHVVSGDAPKVVEDVANTLGINATCVASCASPADKQQYVEKLQASGKVVLFVGDGTNDAVAVAQANVGTQFGNASDVTSAVADVVLLNGLNGVITLLDVSKSAFHRIVFNFVWTAVYNVLAILLAAGAFVKFRIPPSYAGLGEIASVGPVILAAVTMMFEKR